MGAWPFAGALFMAFLFVKDVPALYQSSKITLYLGLGTILLGVIPMT